MALPVFKRFTLQDLGKNAPDWISPLLTSLNLFCEQVLQSLTLGLVIGTNVQGQKFSTQFTTSSTYTTGNFPTLSFNYSGGGKPTCLMIGSLTRQDGTLITTPYQVTSWSLNLNTNPASIKINYIAGLANSTAYNINFIVL